MTMNASERARCARLSTPIGDLVLHVAGGALTAIDFGHQSAVHDAPRAADFEDPVVARAARELDEYFAGRRTTFDVPLAPQGTAFQQRVWKALLGIPYGRTVSYGEIARRIGQPTAVRAVGLANGRNPIPILIPCHRVIGADGSLTGFGGGLPIKRALLALEHAAPREARQPELPLA